jgi:indolepyruvate ferredoxin oxidoreductase
MIARRAAHLVAYQDAAYARRYTDLVARVRAAEAACGAGGTELTEAVARGWHKLLAYKDEYEVARLYSDPAFRQDLAATFEGDYRLRFHLAPPLLARPDPVTGEPRKQSYGPWMMRAFGLLARAKRLRGTILDPFGRTEDRKLERQLVADYERLAESLIAGLEPANHATAVELAGLPQQIRGFGPVKRRHFEQAKRREAELMAAFRQRGGLDRRRQDAPPPSVAVMAG